MTGTESLRSFTLGDLLRSQARVRPDAVALIDDDEIITFADLNRSTDQLANALEGTGIAPGARVLWLGQNSAQVFNLIFAVAKLGGMVCPVNWRQTVAEVDFLIDDLSPHAVFVDPAGVIPSRFGQSGSTDWYDISGDGPRTYTGLLQGVAASERGRDIDWGWPVIGIYTAAFDGRPACALLSHQNLVIENLLIAMAYEFSSADVFLAAGPLFHIAALGQSLATLQVGGRVVVLPRLVAEKVCQAIEDNRCTRAYLPKAMIPQLVNANSQQHFDLSSLRAAPVSPEWDAMITPDHRPGAAVQGYGQTELAGLVTFAAVDGPTVGAFGRPSPLASVRVVDESDHEVPPGEVGELVVRGPTVMVGYWNRPEMTAVRQRGGWHHSSDLVRREIDGSISFVGSKSRLIKSGGENVYPAEVEGALRSHPAVAAVAVVGVPDERWGQAVHADIVLRVGVPATELELIEYCRQRIASYKKPRSVAFVDSLPASSGP